MCDRLILLCNCRFLRGSPFKFKTLASIFFFKRKKKEGGNKEILYSSLCVLRLAAGFQFRI